MPTMPMTTKQPTSEIGIATTGMIAARQVCRNTITTTTTRPMASNSVCSTSLIDCWMNSVGL